MSAKNASVSSATILLENSRSGSITCSFQGKYLHSKYNPLVEGERFANALEADFSPLCVIITEPALSYCAPHVRTRFPNAKICAIRFLPDFHETDGAWDFAFYLADETAESVDSLAEDLFCALGEERLCSSVAFDWAPSLALFPERTRAAWAAIKKTILKARDVIGTRSYFSKRWLKNSITFASHIAHSATIAPIDAPIVITASGPSLESSLPFIRQYRASFFLIAVSSSFMPLTAHGITPDIVLSSDGGYWAKRHLAVQGADNGIILALEAESAVPKTLFETHTIVPLCYDDGSERVFLQAIGCPYMRSERNGTVAGTAVQFALSLTKKSVYVCGLDQAPAPGFQHTQPNALETGNAQNDFRLRTAETRIASSRFLSAGVLETYRNWFVTHSDKFSTRVFRLSDNVPYDFSLGAIKDISWSDFATKEDVTRSFAPQRIFIKTDLTLSHTERISRLQQALDAYSQTTQFDDEVFPMDVILEKRERSPEKRAALRAALIEKKETLAKKCTHLLCDRSTRP